jgi:hypothetical protein
MSIVVCLGVLAGVSAKEASARESNRFFSCEKITVCGGVPGVALFKRDRKVVELCILVELLVDEVSVVSEVSGCVEGVLEFANSMRVRRLICTKKSWGFPRQREI